MKYIFIILALGLSGCAKYVNTFEVHPTIMPYYEQFVKEGINRGQNHSTNNLIMKFGPTEPRTIAYCTTEMSESWVNVVEHRIVETPLVVFNEQYWNSATEAQKRETVSHELGHCLMNLDHNRNISRSGYPESLMYPYSVSRMNQMFYAYYEKFYMDQLFGVRAYAVTNNDGSYIYDSTNIIPNPNAPPPPPTAAIASTAPSKTYVTTIDGCEDHESTDEDIENAHSHIKEAKTGETNGQ